MGSGAWLERINFLAGHSPRAMKQAYGLTVNYLCKLDDIEANHEAFADRSEMITTPTIRLLVAQAGGSRSLAPIGASAVWDLHGKTKTKGSKELTA